jgi:hypothetical protein
MLKPLIKMVEYAAFPANTSISLSVCEPKKLVIRFFQAPMKHMSVRSVQIKAKYDYRHHRTDSLTNLTSVY